MRVTTEFARDCLKWKEDAELLPDVLRERAACIEARDRLAGDRATFQKEARILFDENEALRLQLGKTRDESVMWQTRYESAPGVGTIMLAGGVGILVGVLGAGLLSLSL